MQGNFPIVENLPPKIRSGKRGCVEVIVEYENWRIYIVRCPYWLRKEYAAHRGLGFIEEPDLDLTDEGWQEAFREFILKFGRLSYWPDRYEQIDFYSVDFYALYAAVKLGERDPQKLHELVRSTSDREEFLVAAGLEAAG